MSSKIGEIRIERTGELQGREESQRSEPEGGKQGEIAGKNVFCQAFLVCR